RSKVGCFSRAAHLRASSSSSSREDLVKTPTELFLHIEELFTLKLLIIFKSRRRRQRVLFATGAKDPVSSTDIRCRQRILGVLARAEQQGL
ncbi:hypothetical protein FCV25MIE_28102, partial [Fagus crenata]